MKTRRYAIDRGGPRRLEVRWGRGQQPVEVLLDGAPVASFARAGLDTGARVGLPDGTELLLMLVPRRWWSIAMRDELRVERQGVPVPGSDGDPRTIGRRAGRLVMVLGLLGLLLAAALGKVAQRGDVVLVALEGLGLLALFGLRLPIALATLVLVADAVLALAAGAGLNPTGLIVRALVVVYLVRAWQRMGERAQPSVAPDVRHLPGPPLQPRTPQD